jgi:4-methylaminobutanoate oxidase (formaldehyde-forming)
VPVLGKLGLKKIVNGPDAYTPDGAPIVGPVPGVPNFHVIAGFSLFGIANSGGTGRALAEWIVHGVPEIDLWEYDVRRFGDYAARKAYLVAKAVEAYAMDYAVHYPHLERLAGRPCKTSPIYERLMAQGAVMCARHGWERPLWFAPAGVPARDEPTFDRPNWFPQVGAECRAVRERAGLLDQTSFGKFEVTGLGVTAFLNSLCANEIDVPLGKIVVTQLLNERGGIECDVTVTRLAPERYWIITAAWTTTHDYAWIAWHLPRDGSVTLRDVTAEYAVLSLMGPRARVILNKVTDVELSNAAFPFMTSRALEIGAAPVRAMRISYVGELGWEIYMPAAYQHSVYTRLMDAGGAEGLVNFGYRALDSLRMEKGYRFWGLDLNPQTTPLEAGLERFVKLSKPEFLGRAALLEQKATGLTRTLTCLAVQGNRSIPHGWEPLLAGGELVGHVASGEYGHCVEQTLILAYLPPPLAEPGSRLDLKLFDEPFPATVVAAPVYDPQNLKLKGLPDV